jgi:isochorismate pyruvate lyase
LDFDGEAQTLIQRREARSMEKRTFQSLGEVRAEIDTIDREIVRLIGRRGQCVQEVARFKTDEAAVAAPERFKTMLLARREWAAAEGLDEDMIEELYRNMVSRFIEEEKKHWRRQQPSA